MAGRRRRSKIECQRKEVSLPPMIIFSEGWWLSYLSVPSAMSMGAIDDEGRESGRGLSSSLSASTVSAPPAPPPTEPGRLGNTTDICRAQPHPVATPSCYSRAHHTLSSLPTTHLSLSLPHLPASPPLPPSPHHGFPSSPHLMWSSANQRGSSASARTPRF